uniref:SKP1 component dimerisation domain-containing protein n=1 Tax=Panagrolaimus sp. JU765 TaxID=591449 RepID=A0AC34Q1T6_9BILA
MSDTTAMVLAGEVAPIANAPAADAAPPKMYTIVCKDGVRLEVSEKIVRQSLLFNELLACINDNEPIPIEIPSRPMKAIIEYLELYQDDPPYNPPEGYNCEMTERDTEFFDKIADSDLIRGWLEGKNEAEIRYILQVPDDYTEEEKEAMYQEYSFFDPSQAIVQDAEQPQQ